jgi:thiol-disulfide isomerase/thioredoxin
MGSIATVVLVVVGVLLALMVGMNLLIRVRAQAMRGKPLPELPGRTGASIARAHSALVYFFSPSCGACRTLTPRLRSLAEKNKDVYVLDVTENLEIARAMRIMATPSTVEVSDGKVIGVHVGMLPSDLLQRYA